MEKVSSMGGAGDRWGASRSATLPICTAASPSTPRSRASHRTTPGCAASCSFCRTMYVQTACMHAARTSPNPPSFWTPILHVRCAAAGFKCVMSTQMQVRMHFRAERLSGWD
jgi:hypothetical protein